MNTLATKSRGRLIFSRNNHNINSINIINNNNNTHAHASPLLSSFIAKRAFAGPGDEIRLPKDGKYKNVFNKRVSKCGRYTFYTTYPHDYNEPWPFPPVYDKRGNDLNRDPNWGGYAVDDVHAPPCSITGKPRRALGHYPWIGRPIVPYDDARQHIIDDQVSPYPFFRSGNYEGNRAFYKEWAVMLFWFFGIGYFLDWYWRANVTGSKWRDRLWYREHMMQSKFCWHPRAQVWWSNPTAPIMRPVWYTKDRWYCGHEKWGEYRMDMVFIPAAKDDMYADIDFSTIDFQYYPESLKKKMAVKEQRKLLKK